MDTVTIAIGKVQFEREGHAGQENVPPEPPPLPRVNLPFSFGSVFKLGELCVQVVGQIEGNYRSVASEIEAGGRLIRIWPPRDDVVDWPPEVVIDGPAYEALGSMFVDVFPWSLQEG